MITKIYLDQNLKRRIHLASIIEYVKSYQKSFEEEPLTEVDSLVLSQLAYFDYTILKKNSYLKDIDEKKNEKRLLERNDQNNNALLKEVIKSKRFQTIYIIDTIEQTDKVEQKQFAAITFLLKTGQIYIAFRGTDGTLIGWKEDFNMAFSYPIPAQIAARSYATTIMEKFKTTFYIGGHSKGGNLAVYTACLLPDNLQEKLLYVFSHDGPGFQKEFLDHCFFAKIQHKLKKTIPNNALIGLLLYTQEQYKIIKSNRFYIMGHDPFSWEISNDHFVEVKALDKTTTYTNKILHEWIESLSPSQRNHFVNRLFSIFAATGITSFSDFNLKNQEYFIKLIKAISDLNEEEKQYILKTIKELILLSIKFLPETLK